MDEKKKTLAPENQDSAENKEEETSEDTKGLDYLDKAQLFVRGQVGFKLSRKAQSAFFALFLQVPFRP